MQKRQAAPASKQLLLLLLQALVLACQLQLSSSVCVSPSTNWEVEYAIDDGVCLYTQTTESRSSHNYSQTLAKCALATAVQNIARPVRVESITKKFNLFQFMLRKSIGYSRVWTEAYCHVPTSKFKWTDNSTVAISSSCSSSSARVYVELLVDADREATFEMRSSNDGLQLLVPVCEYEVPKCDPTAVSGYVEGRMQPSRTPYANRNVSIDCSPGYFRRLSGDAASDADRNKFLCAFSPAATGIGSAVLNPYSNAVPDACKPIHCKGQTLLNATIPYVVANFSRSVNSTREYGFGEAIAAQCKPGYVNYADDTNTTSSFQCGQSDLDKSLGMWLPPSLVTCFALKCKEPMPFYDSEKMFAYKAYDRFLDRTYTEIETNRFPYYPNVVHIRCRQAGFFFMDRKYDKTVQCTLPGNGTDNVAVWQPVDGTVLSSAIMNCKQITCLTNEIVIASQQSDLLNYLTSSHINNTLVVTDSTGVTSNLTIKEFTERSDFGFNFKVKFFCNTDHEMSVTNPATGRLEAVESFEVSCSSSGTWATRISACIKRTASLLTGGARKYVPPPKEAEGAQSLGVVVIVILVVFFSTIIILDLTTITRDIGLMRKNLRRIKIKIKMRKAAAEDS